MDKLLRNLSQTLTLTIRNAAGEVDDPDANLVNVVVKDSAGTTVLASTQASRDSAGIYSVVVGKANVTGTLDIYEAEWTWTENSAAQSAVTRFEVVGSFLFGIQELRDFDTDITVEKFSDTRIRAARDIAEEQLEALCGVALRQRGRRVSLNGVGRSDLLVPDLYPRVVVSAKTDGGSGFVDFTSAEIAELLLYDYGAIVRPDLKVWDAGFNSVGVHYEHGLLEPPEPLRRAAMLLARRWLVQSGLPVDGVISYTTAGGDVFRLAVPGRDGPTGLPEVDALIQLYGQHRPVVA